MEADSPDLVAAMRLLDDLKVRGFRLRRVAPGEDGPLVGHRVSGDYVDLIHIEGFSRDCFAWRKRTSSLIVPGDGLFGAAAARVNAGLHLAGRLPAGDLVEFPIRPARPTHDAQGGTMFNSTLSSVEADTGYALVELARFFAVAADSSQICPMFSTYIDQAWHTLLATPDSYAKFSWEACGQILGHQASLGEGRIPWVSDYEARFGKLPPLWFADATGTIDQTGYAVYRETGEVFRSWDCNPTTNEDE